MQATIHYLNQWWLVYWRIYTSLGLIELNYNYMHVYVHIYGGVEGSLTFSTTDDLVSHLYEISAVVISRGRLTCPCYKAIIVIAEVLLTHLYDIAAAVSHGRHIISSVCMMTSSNGHIFRVTGPLCGEFTGLRWITRTKVSDAELWCFLWFAPE